MTSEKKDGASSELASVRREKTFNNTKSSFLSFPLDKKLQLLLQGVPFDTHSPRRGHARYHSGRRVWQLVSVKIKNQYCFLPARCQLKDEYPSGTSVSDDIHDKTGWLYYTHHCVTRKVLLPAAK